MVPVSAGPLINRCSAHRTLLQNGRHIACGAGDIVIWHHRRPHWLKRSVGGVPPVGRDRSLTTLGKLDQTILLDNVCYSQNKQSGVQHSKTKQL